MTFPDEEYKPLEPFLKECWQRGEKAFRTVVLLSLLALMEAGPLDAQTFYGTIVGTVTDGSGGAIAGARVSVTNSGTAEGLAAQTDLKGNYQFPNLLPGIYRLDVEQPHFKHLTLDQIQVRVKGNFRSAHALRSGQTTTMTTSAGYAEFTLPSLDEYELLDLG